MTTLRPGRAAGPASRAVRSRRIAGLASLTLLAGPPLAAARAAPVQAEADVVTTLKVSGEASEPGPPGAGPILGASGALEWYAARPATPFPRRALTRFAASGANPSALVKTTVRGTVAVRGTSTTGVSPTGQTGVAAVDGRTWILDHVVVGGVSRPMLRGLLDGSARTRSITFPAGYEPADVIPTDQGIRTVGDDPAGSGSPAVTGPGGSAPVRLAGVMRIVSAAAMSGGRLLVAADPEVAGPRALLIVSAAGEVQPLGDRAAAGAAFFTGGAGLAVTGAGIAVDEVGVISGEDTPDQGALVLRDPQTGAVTARRMLRDLDVPKDPLCTGADAHFRVTRLTSGPAGLPIATVVCGNRGAFSDPLTGAPYRAAGDVQAVMVGLAADLTVRWWRPAPEHPFSVRPTLEGADPDQLVTGAEGRLHLIGGDRTVRSFAEPGATRPATGTLGAHRRLSRHGVRVRITCRGPVGTICAGTAEVRVRGRVIGAAPYALPARPGAAAATLDRRITTNRTVPARSTVRLRAQGVG